MISNKRPFFSIVIPTKNRPAYLKDSVISVIRQNFNDFELVISDNYNKPSTYEAVSQFLSDQRVRYFRTDHEMNMPDHWEWATSKAKGEWVILLADRKLLYQGSLKHIHQLIKRHKGRYRNYSFRVKTYDNELARMGWYPETCSSRSFKSHTLIENFIHQNYLDDSSFDRYFPKTLNSCYHRLQAEEVRSRCGNYFNIHGVTTPDYSSCFINLLTNEEIFYISRPVLLTQGEQSSNGRIFTSGKTDAYRNALGLSDEEIYAFVPVRAPFVTNWLMHDFILVSAVLGKEPKGLTNPVNYYAQLMQELSYKKEQTTLYTSALQHALYREDRRIREDAQALFLKRQNHPAVKAGLRTHLRDFINYRFSHIKPINRMMGYRFSTALEAAGFDKQYDPGNKK